MSSTPDSRKTFLIRSQIKYPMILSNRLMEDYNGERSREIPGHEFTDPLTSARFSPTLRGSGGRR